MKSPNFKETSMLKSRTKCKTENAANQTIHTYSTSACIKINVSTKIKFKVLNKTC